MTLLRSYSPVGNAGGIRWAGNRSEPLLVALSTTRRDPDWPDRFEPESGVFTYFGDNKRPTGDLHDTPRGGNSLLRDLFDRAVASGTYPPILIFANDGRGRDREFLGLAVPRTNGTSPSDGLVVVDTVASGEVFQNYRAEFTVLNARVIRRAWLTDVLAGDSPRPNAPEGWPSSLPA